MGNFNVLFAKTLVSFILLHPKTSYSLKLSSRPIRLNVIDGDGSPIQVEMHKDGSHYFFVPITANGTRLERNPNLKDPDEELARIIETDMNYGSSGESAEDQLPKDDENLVRKEATETNIDTQDLLNKSPTSQEQSFNQSSFKQKNSTPTFRYMKGGESAVSPYGLSNNGVYFSKVSTSNEDKEFYYLEPEYFNDTNTPITILPLEEIKVSLNPPESTTKQSSITEQIGKSEQMQSSSNSAAAREESEITTSTTTQISTTITSPNDFSISQGNKIKSQNSGNNVLRMNTQKKFNTSLRRDSISSPKYHSSLKKIENPMENPDEQLFSRTISVITRKKKRLNFVFISKGGKQKKGESTKKYFHNTKNTMRRKTTTTVKPYPNELVENVTCLASNSILERKRTLSSIYHKSSSSCPFNYPCMTYSSCSLWTTGLVGEDLTMNKWITLSYLQDIFHIVHPKKLSLIKKTFKNCVNHYETTVPFSKAIPSIDCETRIQSISECLQVAESKGTCLFSSSQVIGI